METGCEDPLCKEDLSANIDDCVALQRNRTKRTSDVVCSGRGHFLSSGEKLGRPG